MRGRCWLLAGLLACPGVVVWADPTTAFDTLGAGDTFYGSAGYVLNYHSIATPFTNNIAGSLDSLKVGLVQTLGGSSQFQISLQRDAGGVPSGSSLEMWSIVGAAASGPTAPVTFFESGTHPTLAQNAVYWLVEQVGNPTDYRQLGTAAFNDQQIKGTLYAQFIDGSSGAGATWTELSNASLLPAFQVRIDAIPEPSPLLVLFAGLAIFGLVAARRKVA